MRLEKIDSTPEGQGAILVLSLISIIREPSVKSNGKSDGENM